MQLKLKLKWISLGTAQKFLFLQRRAQSLGDVRLGPIYRLEKQRGPLRNGIHEKRQDKWR